MWKIAAVAVFLIEAVLSHTPGDQSGSQSQALSSFIHVDEKLLRRSAHIIFFALMALLGAEGFGWIGVSITALWSIVDEISKKLIPGRHFSWRDVGLNLAGTAAGMAVWLVVR